jgi:hypothetical protein
MMSITVREDILNVLQTVSVNVSNPPVDSTNVTTGAIVVSGGGGLGVDGQVFMGGNMDVTVTSNLKGIVTIGETPTEYSLPVNKGGDAEYLQQSGTGATFTDPRSITSVNYDSILVTPGSGSVIKSLDVGQTAGVATADVSTSGGVSGVSSISVTGATGKSTIGGIITVGSGTPSSSVTTGAIIVSGGMGVSENLRVGSGSSSIQGATSVNNILTSGVSGQQYSFPVAQGALNQVVTITSTVSGALEFVTPVIDNSDDVIAPIPFGVDNLLIRTTGSGRDVEGTGIVMSDTNDMSGVGSLSVLGASNIGSVVGTAVQVTGGMGVTENINVDGVTTYNGSTIFSSTIESTSTSNGALVVSGGCGVIGDVNVGGTLDATSIDFTGVDLSILSTEPSLSTNTGALTVTGGASIGNINVGGSADIGGSVVIEDMHISDTTDSTSNTTGALTILGGVGIVKSVNIGGVVFANDLSGASISVDGGVGITSDVFVNTASTDSTAITGTTLLTNGLNSNSTDTGTLVVNGGVGIRDDVYIGGSVFINGFVEETVKFIHLVHTTTVSVSSLTPLSLPWGTTIRKDSSLYTHSPGTSGITIIESGWYDITLDVTSQIEGGDGGRRSVSAVFLTNGGVTIPRSNGYMYNRTASVGFGQTTVQLLVELTAGDIIDARIYRVAAAGLGSIITTVSNACRILIEKV